ncbi:hypothetical protein J5N97_028167 [Dioscorea zingiberensis]|uniref:Uncharacterized protein n=1 Tax=Dioscorea zingiberensis TaxID=325984 RepID=A0A9D5H4G1_9LILI|nr:hypothetical protein J5N97_028167 [Dioscorea zingiberensis]
MAHRCCALKAAGAHRNEGLRAWGGACGGWSELSLAGDGMAIHVQVQMVPELGKGRRGGALGLYGRRCRCARSSRDCRRCSLRLRMKAGRRTGPRQGGGLVVGWRRAGCWPGRRRLTARAGVFSGAAWTADSGPGSQAWGTADGVQGERARQGAVDGALDWGCSPEKKLAGRRERRRG